MGLGWLSGPLYCSQDHCRASGLPLTLTSAGEVAKSGGNRDQGSGQGGLVGYQGREKREMVPVLCPGLGAVVTGRGQAGQVTRSHSTSAN